MHVCRRLRWALLASLRHFLGLPDVVLYPLALPGAFTAKVPLVSAVVSFSLPAGAVLVGRPVSRAFSGKGPSSGHLKQQEPIALEA